MGRAPTVYCSCSTRRRPTRLRIINADGSADMCGNGVRCLARYLDEHDGRSGGRRNAIRPVATRVLSREPYLVSKSWACRRSVLRTTWLRSRNAGRRRQRTRRSSSTIFRRSTSTVGPRICNDPRYPGGVNAHFVQIDGGRCACCTGSAARGDRGLACGTGAVGRLGGRDCRARVRLTGDASDAGRNAAGGVVARRTRDPDRRRGRRIRWQRSADGRRLSFIAMQGAGASTSTRRRRRIAADGGIVRDVAPAELIPLPPGAVVSMLPGRSPSLFCGRPFGAPSHCPRCWLPAGYTRTLLPAFRRKTAPQLPLFGYNVRSGDRRRARSGGDADRRGGEDWQPRRFAAGELGGHHGAAHGDRLRATEPRATQHLRANTGAFHRAERVSRTRRSGDSGGPKCNAACVGCISELDADSAIPPQTRAWRSSRRSRTWSASACTHLSARRRAWHRFVRTRMRGRAPVAVDRDCGGDRTLIRAEPVERHRSTATPTIAAEIAAAPHRCRFCRPCG